jgi:hypothetical protein
MSATLCHYAADPDRRPGCQVTAAVRRGAIALCASCDALRSTLGKGQPATPIPAAAPASVLDWISQARTRLLDAEAEVTAAVTNARQHGHSWAAIAARLEITRQAAQQRYVNQQAQQHPALAGARSGRADSSDRRNTGGFRELRWLMDGRVLRR